MDVRMPITKAKIKNHFQYSLWKYLVLVAVSVLLWNFLFTITRYRTPGTLKVEFFADGYSDADADAAMDSLLHTIHMEALPEMEEITYSRLVIDSVYGDMQLMVWAGAGQGDVYLLFQDRFTNLAKGSAMLDLQPFIDQKLLHTEGMDLRRGKIRNDETGQMIQYGIPADSLAGLAPCGGATEGAMLSVLAASGNKANALRFLDYLLTHLLEDEPAESN